MKPILYFSLFFIFACNPVQPDPKVSQNSISGGSVFSKWSLSNLPTNLKISNDFSADEIGAIQALEVSWESALSNRVNFFTTTATTSNKDFSNLDNYQDNEFGIYKNYHWPTADLPAGALAVTQIFGSRHNSGTKSEYIEITHADILVNYDFFTFSYNHAPGTYDLKTVLLHEMGHFIGLYHNATDLSSVMYPYISASSEKQTPYVLDVNNVNSLYGLSSSSSALTAMDVPQASGISVTKSDQSSGPEVKVPSVPVRIIIELMSDGKCHHKVDGKLVETH